ncbi:MAG: adenosine deaminase [Actinomycetota bacterium]|nr:adenosine deaminase [Actinomycetota bacterium]
MTAHRDLLALPKGHLHLHLEGAMRPSTLAELAATHGIDVPPIRGFKSFTAFAGMYAAACAVLATEADLRRLVREVVEDAADDGVTWLEPSFYSPRHQSAFGSNEAAIEIVLDELAAAGNACGIGTGLIIAADRTEDPAESSTLATIAVSLAERGVVGFGLANDEANWPPGPFAAAFAVAVDGGLMSVPHGGELSGPESVVGCIEDCRAARVMHGVRAVESPDLVAHLAERGICLDVCPTSNVLLGVVPTLEAHPLPALLDAGVRCSVNADDPLLFGPGVLDEYRLCRDRIGLDDTRLARVARCSLEDSAAPRGLVAAGVAAIDAWLAAAPGPA